MKRIHLFIVGNSVLLALWLTASFYTPSSIASANEHHFKKEKNTATQTSKKEEQKQISNIVTTRVKNKVQ